MTFKGRPMISYALDALIPVVDYVMINANRNIEQYRQFGHPVISDQTDSFDGPLAGVLTAMLQVEAEVLVVIPCDSPFIKAEYLQKLLLSRAANNADVAVAFDGVRVHPVFMAIKTALRKSLQDYLVGGQRKVVSWLEQQNLVKVEFTNEAEIFRNINTLTELFELESLGAFGCKDSGA